MEVLYMATLNNVELLKIAKDGLEVRKDMDRYGTLGFAAITPDDIERFKWLGLYQQTPKPEGYFMMRIKIPGGSLNSTQMRVIAGIAKQYGREIVDITTRQALQFHWLRVENLPDILGRLAAVGLSTVGAAGDCPRNVVGHPLAGIDPDEVIDTSALIEAVNKHFENNREFSNLPRKFKISISGSKYNTGHAEINDVAFTPAEKEIDGKMVVGFHVMVGGGLSRNPQFAQQINAFVLPEQVINVLTGVTAIFRDHGYREKRNHARLKFLVADWGISKFTEELFKITGPLLSKGTDLTIGWNGGYFHGVHKQKQLGLSYIGLPVTAGRCSAEDMEELADLADNYGDGALRTSNSQNLILANIDDKKVDALLEESLLQRFNPFDKSISASVVACAGKEFCPFALTKTKQYIEPVSNYVDQNITLDQPVRIHISGCPHSCAQPQIADIGLQGTSVRVDGTAIEAFEIWLGGSLGVDAVIASRLQGTISAEDIALALEEIIQIYQENKEAAETFTGFVKRIGLQRFQEKLDKFSLEIESKLA
jgi:ferredoxin-nitrite reductase